MLTRVQETLPLILREQDSHHEQFETYYVNPRAPMHLLLALNDGRIVGMISWTLTHELYSADTRVYISTVSIESTARSQGVGSALMDQVKIWARAHNAQKLGWEVWHRNFEPRSSMKNWVPRSIKRLSLMFWRLRTTCLFDLID
jgi:GNAT superfamily N-acetyltransferase